MNSIQKILDEVESNPSIKEEMQKIHFTADLHHSHPKIVNICNRPTTVEEHDEWLVKEAFNKYIGRKDTVFILGDLSLARRPEAEKFIDRLNGNKFLILGNHDKNIDTSTRFAQITQIKDFRFKRPGVDIHIALCHYPMASWDRKPHGSWHLYGHVHGRYKNPGLSLDVGIDNPEIGWRPINLYEVALIMADKERDLGIGNYYDNGLEGVD